MKIFKPVALALLLGLAGVGSAWADHGGHVHFGVVVGGPYWGPWGYPPAYYYPPYYHYHPYYPQAPIVIERPVPQVYIEQAEPAPAVSVPPASAPAEQAAAPANDWYYCAGARGYYPYVKECPGGWQRVPAQPPGQR